jgi:hypothetical protein
MVAKAVRYDLNPARAPDSVIPAVKASRDLILGRDAETLTY